MNIFTAAPKASRLYGYDLADPRYGLLASFYRTMLLSYLDKGERIEAFNGGLLGADLVFAKVCVDLRDRQGADIFCGMFIPYPNHSIMWDEKNRRLSHELVKRMDSLKMENKAYDLSSIQRRNDWFMERCDVCLAVHDSGKNEVWRVMNESLRRGLKVFQFNFATNRVTRYKGVKTLKIQAETARAN